jgi:hypothetical protein
MRSVIFFIFEQLSVLKINFHKSEIFCFGKAKDEERQYKQLFGYESRSLPFRYLGVSSNTEHFITQNGSQQKTALNGRVRIGRIL